MLEKGFHKSFSELFNLVQQQKRQHEEAGPAAVLLEPLIHSDHAKLEYLRVQLTAAEDAERAGNLEGVYAALKSLAQYFDRNRGTWLSFHFHQRSLEVAQRIQGDNQRAEGEGQCSVGLAMEKRGGASSANHLSAMYVLFLSVCLSQEICRELWVTLRPIGGWQASGSGVLSLGRECMR